MSEVSDFKVVVGGPFASGKTTLILAISDIPVVGTEAPTSGDEALVKPTATVGMEYGVYSAGEGELEVNLYLYGVPGQDRFRFMWDIVAEGMDGFVLIVDATDPTTWSEAARVGDHFHSRRDVPTVVAVNRAGGQPELVEAVRSAIPIAGAGYQACEVTDQPSARDVLIELLLLLLYRMAEDEVAV